MPPSNCGKHTELVANQSVKVTRCTCGTVHVTLLASGVTVRMSQEQLRGVAAGLTSALDGADDQPHLGTTTIN
jgi:hypothetical protein